MAIVTLASAPCPYSFARKSPLTLDGEIGVGWSGDVTFRVAAADLYNFCIFAGGTKVTNTGGVYSYGPYTVGGASRYIPLSHPDLGSLLCTRIKSHTAGGYTGTNTAALSNWSDAFVTCTFTSVPYLIDGTVPFSKIDLDAGAEVYTLAGSKLKFPSDGLVINADAGVTVGTTIYQVSIYLAVSLDDSTINPLKGCCNNATFLGQPTGTVRFDGYKSTTTMTSGGQIAYTRTLSCVQRNVPWNQFLRPDGTWEEPLTTASATVYTLADLSPLVS